MVRDGKFLEWAGVHDNSYGTSIEAFRAGNIDEISRIYFVAKHVAKHVLLILSSCPQITRMLRAINSFCLASVARE
jgi:guanylate kinase